jgi:outer membrane immunogenic protein
MTMVDPVVSAVECSQIAWQTYLASDQANQDVKPSSAQVAASAAFLATGLAISGLLGPVQAADMGVLSRSYYPLPPPAIYDWTGIYVGGHIGGGMLVDSVSQNGVSPSGFNLANTGNLRPAGVIGGAQVGANYEFAPWVVGLEGSWTDSAINGNTLIGCTGPCATQTAIAQERFTSQAQWFAALTGRFGYAANDWLFYGKAGGAWMDVRYTEDPLTAGAPGVAPGATAATQVNTDTRTGFTVGAGIEFGLVENLSAKVEYDFYDFGSKNYNFNAITPVSVNSNLHTIIVGLNYKFNWSGGPKP